MANVKRSAKVQNWRGEQLKALREQRDRVKSLVTMEGLPEWDAMRSVIRTFLKFADNEKRIVLRDMRRAEDSDSELVKKFREVCQKEDDFTLVLDLVDKNKEQLEALNERIRELESEYKDAAGELAEIGG